MCETLKKSMRLCLISALTVVPVMLFSAELSKDLREASQMYRIGRFDEAREKALSYHRAFPKEVEPLLILGRTDFARGDLLLSRRWFRQASAIDPRHPIVVQYRKLLDEYEHRKGQLEPTPLPLPVPDKGVTADRFKRGWFGPSFPVTSAKTGSEALEVASETSRADYGVTEEKVIENPVEKIAIEAFKEGLYFKAYLFFSQLHREHPQRADFLFYKAKAAFRMGRFKETAGILNHLLRFHDPPLTVEAQASATVMLKKTKQLIQSD